MTVVEKPWGREELLEINDFYLVKRLTMDGGHRCSLQYHERKLETVYVLSGRMRFVYGALDGGLESREYGPGESFTVPVRMVHRMEAVEDCVYLEASTPDLDDVVRVSDDYNRAGS